MDRRLFTAALTGDLGALFELLHEDPLVLHRVSLTSSETPLHIASLVGHVEFARVTMQQNPKLARKLNQQGLSPIHIASLIGYVEIVRELLNMDVELGTLRDSEGRTPLHCAVIKGSQEVLTELLSLRPESAQELTPSEETVLHLAVKHNQCPTFASLILILGSSEFLGELINSVDEEGNTVLHLATARKQYQTLKILLSDAKVDVNAVNSNGQTALDLLETCPLESDDKVIISELLRHAGGEGASSSPRPSQSQPSPEGRKSTKRSREDRESTEPSSGYSERVVESVKSGIVALAALFASVTFEVALNPPGGFWQNWDAMNDTNVIEAAQKSNFTNIGLLWLGNVTAMTWPIKKLIGGPIPKLNVTEPELRGPAKAMNVALSGDNFIKFLYFDTICFMGSLATIFIVMFLSKFRRQQSIAVMLMMVMVLLSAGAVYGYGVSLVTNKKFGSWVIKVGITHLIMAALFVSSIASLFEPGIRKRIKKKVKDIRKTIKCCLTGIKWLCRKFNSFIRFRE